jgi:hypothetical protein
MKRSNCIFDNIENAIAPLKDLNVKDNTSSKLT